MSAEVAEALLGQFDQLWGTEAMAAMFAPSRAGDQRFRRWLARFQRTIASPRTVQAFLRVNFEMDARPILPLIQAPTLILHRRDFQFLPIAHGRYLAEHIPGATLVEHGKANAGPGSNASLSRFCTRTSFPRIGTCHLRERPTARDRCEPLGSDGVWTKRDQARPLSGAATLHVANLGWQGRPPPAAPDKRARPGIVVPSTLRVQTTPITVGVSDYEVLLSTDALEPRPEGFEPDTRPFCRLRSER